MEQRWMTGPPGAGEPLRLVRSPGEGVWWERGDGLAVRLAASEHEAPLERGRISLLGMLLAWAASDAPER